MSTNQLNRKLLRRAWDIAWPHKHLWVFGFFATFAGFGSVSEIFFRSYGRAIDVIPSLSGTTPLFDFVGAGYLRAVISVSPTPLLTMFILGIMGLLLIAVSVWVVTISIGALIRSCDRLGRNVGDVHFNEGVVLGRPRFWPIFAINLTEKALVFLAALLTGTSLFVFVSDNDLISGMLFILSFVMFVGLAIAIGNVGTYASIEAAIHGTGFLESIRRSIKLFLRNWLVSLETTLLVLGISASFALAALTLTVVIALPLVLLMMVVAEIGTKITIGAILVLLSATVLTIIIALGSFLTTMQTAIWTLLWDELNKRHPIPLIGRIIGWALKRSK